MSIYNHSSTMNANNPTRRDLIIKHFYEGYSYKDIVQFLFVNGYVLSTRQLKRILHNLNLRRRVANTPLHDEVVNYIIKRELNGPGNQLGYRAMHRRIIIKYGIPTSRFKVMNTLKRLDPLGTQLRKQHRLRRRQYHNMGPSYVWHCDGNDKIKRYGFCIHGCIDGFSRKVLWLKVAVTNNNPAVIAYYFLECVRNLKGTPRLLRCDMGTENSRLAFIQPFLRRNCTDSFAGISSFQYGKSTSNQRIEAWWGHLRRSCLQWWMDLFQGLEDEGIYTSSCLIHECSLRLCFMHLIQKSLDEVVREWNWHRIRPSHNTRAPSGIPDKLFFLPTYSRRTFLSDVNASDLSVADHYAEEPDTPAPLEFLEAAQLIMHQNNIHFPRSIHNAINAFVTLISFFE